MVLCFEELSQSGGFLTSDREIEGLFLRRDGRERGIEFSLTYSLRREISCKKPLSISSQVQLI